ncbi:MAG: GNAT family N-acetyltransferase [Chthoniobacterales bacterium]
MSDAPSIQPVAPRDIETAVALLEAQLEEHEIVTARDALHAVVREVVADSRHGFMLLAWADDRAVGLAYAAAHLSAEHGGIIGWLEELYVLPDSRGRGVGGALLREIAIRAQALDWRGLELEIVAGHERAVALYQRNGFRPQARARFSRVFDRPD